MVQKDRSSVQKRFLDQAVTLFEQRLDNKRSDEYFVSVFKKITEPNKALHSFFLYLPEAETEDD